MKITLLSLAITFILIFTLHAQSPLPTPANERLSGFEQRLSLKENSEVKTLKFRNVGPVNMSGRVTDLDVNENDPTEFFVAYASGGLWHTSNNGISFKPVFDRQSVMTLGDIAVDWDNGIIWAGTGENNSSRSSYAGTGIYRSDDMGETWEYRGLAETHHTGRIILHPEDPDILWVAAIGHLYSPNEERGVYKTIDGGETWSKTHYVDENTGAIDLVMDPSNPDVLYAAMWTRERRAWNLKESGKGSGIFKSTDGGMSWELITNNGSGFPTGEGTGRIGLAIYPGDSDILYAFLDNNFHQPEKEKEPTSELSSERLKNMSRKEFLDLDKKKIADFLESNNFPEKYHADTLISMVRKEVIQPKALAEYLEDENSLLFDTPVIGAELYRSDDGGASWRKTHDELLEGLVYTYGYYFGEVRISPFDPDEVYLLGVPLIISKDGGRSFQPVSQENLHGDHHALWVSPSDQGHLISGNDGGVNISYDNGETWYKANVTPTGQFYSVNYDMQEPYHVYGGLQDNGVWSGPSTYDPEDAWHTRGRDPYERIGGGDGMQVEIDHRTNKTVYSGSQFGFYYRYNTETKEREAIKPRHELGERPLRFNWETPIHLSRHNQDILYYGANRLYRSLNRGEELKAISPDLTNGGRKGDVSYGTLTTIHESPIRFGLIYTGSDDGLVYVSRDGGQEWENISAGLPEQMWISQVYASHHKENRVYVSLNGYRWDHFEPYIYVSDDYGKNWRDISGGLPPEAVNVIKEDPLREGLIYAGTDHGIYMSYNNGEKWMAFSQGLPDAPFHDLVIHPRDKDLIAGSHGRSIFIADLEEVQMLPEINEKALHIFPAETIRRYDYWGRKWNNFYPAYEPETRIAWYADREGITSIRILDEEGSVMNQFEREHSKGLNYTNYDLSISADAARRLKKDRLPDKADNGVRYLKKGNYTIEIEWAGEKQSTGLHIE